MANDLHSIRERIAHSLYIDSRGSTLPPEFIERQWAEGHVVRDEFYRRADAAMAVVVPALAEAWDEGYDVGNRGQRDPNPYRKGN